MGTAHSVSILNAPLMHKSCSHQGKQGIKKDTEHLSPNPLKIVTLTSDTLLHPMMGEWELLKINAASGVQKNIEILRTFTKCGECSRFLDDLHCFVLLLKQLRVVTCTLWNHAKRNVICSLLDVILANQIPCCIRFSFLFLRSIATSASSSATTENAANSEATAAKGSFIFNKW